MTAKELFEDCGYELREESDRYIGYYDEFNDSIYFDLKNREILIEEMEVNIDLFKAIQKQLEELDWI